MGRRAADVVVEVDLSPAEGDVQQLIDGLTEFNTREGPPGRFLRLAVFVRDAAGRIRGGAVATRKWDWLFVSHLWLEGELRGRGLGTQVMAALEAQARADGCTAIHLETLGFQAKAFYEGLGFTQFAELANYAAGHGRHYMWKRL